MESDHAMMEGGFLGDFGHGIAKDGDWDRQMKSDGRSTRRYEMDLKITPARASGGTCPLEENPTEGGIMADDTEGTTDKANVFVHYYQQTRGNRVGSSLRASLRWRIETVPISKSPLFHPAMSSALNSVFRINNVGLHVLTSRPVR